MKRVVILQHGPSTGIHGQLANQMWNYVSVYAYGVERGVPVYNYSFFEYHRYFGMPVGNALVNRLFFAPFDMLVRFVPERRLIPVWRKFYKLFVLATEALAHDRVVRSRDTGHADATYRLPPSTGVRDELLRKERDSRPLYFDGWLFRNPEGLRKHREAIRAHFAPIPAIQDRIERFLAPLRGDYPNVIGIHVRQGDYRTWKDGKYFVPQARVRDIVDEYLAVSGLDPARTCFVITSDGPIDESVFRGLHIAVTHGTAVEDLFTLAGTDAVIGSDSSFGDFAAYWGNVPHIVLKNEPMDWGYYRGKDRFFENAYCTFVHY